MKYTGNDLVTYAKYQLGKPYWYGTYGCIASADLLALKERQYPARYNKWPRQSFVDQYGLKVHDCSGLVKGLFMTPDALKQPNAPAVYNSKYDWSANGLIEACEKQGPISLLPEVPGLILWKNGHVGIYEGNGYVIEAKGHSYGVIRSRLSDTNWIRYGECPYLDYSSQPQPEPTPTPKGDKCMVELDVLRKGSKDKDGENAVKSLQSLLNTYGYRDQNGDRLDVDGSFGGKTDYAVKAFQKAVYPACGDVDGVVGKKTWTKLIEG